MCFRPRLLLARDEWGRAIEVTVKRLELGDDLPAFDMTVRHRTGFANDVRVFLCNRPTQGGGLKRQLDKVLDVDAGQALLHAARHPTSRRTRRTRRRRRSANSATAAAASCSCRSPSGNA